jgi:hypothetical protein
VEAWITKSLRHTEGPDDVPGLFYSERDNTVASLELEPLPSPSQYLLLHHRVGPADPLERIDCD